MASITSFAEWVFSWLGDHESLAWFMASTSVLFFVVSLLLIPWLIIRIPADYFSEPGRYRSALFVDYPLAAVLLKSLRNLLGICFIFLGLLLLLLPGQGLLTILLGLVVADFPGKHKLVNWLVTRDGVLRSMNWLRRKAGKEPIELKE